MCDWFPHGDCHWQAITREGVAVAFNFRNKGFMAKITENPKKNCILCMISVQSDALRGVAQFG